MEMELKTLIVFLKIRNLLGWVFFLQKNPKQHFL